MRLAHARIEYSTVWATPSNGSRVFRNKDKEIIGEVVFSTLIISKYFNKMFLSINIGRMSGVKLI